MVIHIAVHDLDHMVGVVVGHHLDHVEDIHVHVEDDLDHDLDADLGPGKDTEVEIDVQEREKGHGPERSLSLEIENANHLEKNEDLDLNLDVAQDPEVIRKIKNILQKEKKINQKNVKIKTRKKTILRLLYLKLKKLINQLRLKKKNPGQLRHQEVILEARGLLVNHLEEVVRLVGA